MFQTFGRYQNACIENTKDKNLNVKIPNHDNNSLLFTNIQNSNPIYMLEFVIWAYDSGFQLGAFDSKVDNGSLLIYE